MIPAVEEIKKEIQRKIMKLEEIYTPRFIWHWLCTFETYVKYKEWKNATIYNFMKNHLEFNEKLDKYIVERVAKLQEEIEFLKNI